MRVSITPTAVRARWVCVLCGEFHRTGPCPCPIASREAGR